MTDPGVPPRGEPAKVEEKHFARAAAFYGDPDVDITPLASAFAEFELERDSEWWDALAGVPGVGPTPQDVKRWVIAENELVERDLACALRECLIGSPHSENAPEGCLCRWCKARRLLAALRAGAAQDEQGEGPR